MELMILRRWKVIRTDMKFIGNHHNAVEMLLALRIDALHSHIDEALDVCDPDLAQEVFEEFGAERYDFEHNYPSMHRCSMLLSLYSVLESALAQYCRYLSECLDVQGPPPARGNIRKYRDYLEKTVGVDFSAAEIYWRELDAFRQLRNSIVHSSGDIGSNSQLHEYVERSVHISFRDAGLGYVHADGFGFELKATFISHVTATMSAFFERLTDGARPLFHLSESEIETVLGLDDVD
ncbi:hypothetical protein [Pseudoduganella flava]|uniref:RiboL-PSP-HEPN domain-containing protein n=1 Tax=Pseudoduganella flava TaxID=871742 RepID=A0ABX6FMY2_9BURK|nr:hypothetical protein [Pseudoduganella flava]QGZ38923.1 hypothetical protein GO485_07595 [Pseudoduganella flava]